MLLEVWVVGWAEGSFDSSKVDSHRPETVFDVVADLVGKIGTASLHASWSGAHWRDIARLRRDYDTAGLGLGCELSTVRVGRRRG